MKFKIKKLEDLEPFDPNSICENVPFTQANFYGEWQKKLGRKVERFVVSEKENLAYFQVIKYQLFDDKNYLYIPYGPVIKKDLLDKTEAEELLLFLKNEIQKIARAEKAIFARLDFTPSVSSNLLAEIFTKSWENTYHAAAFQPRVEWSLNLKKSEHEILEAMHKDHRYSIRTAENRGAKVEIVTENFQKYFETFYELMTETAQRNKFKLHPKEYYENIFQSLSAENAYLVVATYEDKILVIDLFIVFGSTANYVFGCSSNEERNRLPNYLAQWGAIKYAKNIGCQSYNFGGISTGDKKFSGWEGLTSFKKRFGGHEVHHSDFFDVVVKPFWYYLYNFRKLLK